MTPPEPVRGAETAPGGGPQGNAASGDAATVASPAANEGTLSSDPRIAVLAAAFVDRAARIDLRSAAWQRLVAEVGEIGEREVVATAALSRRLVDRPIRAISGALDGDSPIARGLAELREAVEDLDPAHLGSAAGGRPRKLLGLIPLGDPTADALERYARARARIAAILGDLGAARSRLQAEIAAIGQDQRALATEIETLRQYAELARLLDDGVAARIATIEADDPERAAILRADVLFAIRQRRQDLLVQLAVATQGDVALRVVQDNNQQVVRAIRMAMTTTAAAMRTSVAVAQAMADQRRIIAQLRTVRAGSRVAPRADRTTGTSGPPASLPAASGRTAVPGVDLAGLKHAWDSVFATLDQFDAYSVTAIDAMRDAVAELAEEAERSRAALEADRAGEDPAGLGST